MKALFILKQNESYGQKAAKSGLLNSASYVADALIQFYGIEAKVVAVIDGNCIDKELHQFRPKLCFIEALWVTPCKMQELASLYPEILFIVRAHSRTTFLAMEGIAIEWIKGYNEISNVYVSFNNFSTNREFEALVNSVFLPNIYYLSSQISHPQTLNTLSHHKTVHIGCFGAIRPLKNHLHQAIAAINYGNEHKKHVHFHINAGRIEQNGENILKNLRALFSNTRHRLIEHGWLERPEFLSLVSEMDMGMQLSLTESFNIVTADFINQGVPIIVSEEIEWMPEITKIRGSHTDCIVDRMGEVLNHKDRFVHESACALKAYNMEAIKQWGHFISTVKH